MTRRINFELLESPCREPKKWARIKRILLDAGGTHISEPTGDPPYTLRAVMPDETRALEVVEILRSTDGVGRAELDEWRIGFSGEI